MSYYIKETQEFINDECCNRYEIWADYGTIMNLFLDFMGVWSYGHFRQVIFKQYQTRECAETALNEYIKYKEGK